MGGWSAEREVSLRSGKACADALDKLGGYRVSRVDVDREVAATLRALKPDAALNVLHGRPGEDGTLQGMLEILGIPYSHSGVLASAVAMQKDIAKTVLKAAQVPVPGGHMVSRLEAAKAHCCRGLTSSSRWRKAPASASSSCARTTSTRRRSSRAPTGNTARWFWSSPSSPARS